jgi:hypothetical protein
MLARKTDLTKWIEVMDILEEREENREENRKRRVERVAMKNR